MADTPLTPAADAGTPVPDWHLALELLPARGAPEQLLVLLHGWGEQGVHMAPLARALKRQFPQAAILAPDAPHPRDPGRSGEAEGRQWYSIRGIEDHGLWAGRVRELLDPLQAWLRAQQQRLGVGQAATALAGFSQGAILSLEVTARFDGLAGRVLAFGGRYVEPPVVAPRLTTLHFFHGEDDDVIPAQASRDALEALAELQGDATLDIARGVGHELHPALIDCALQRLTSHIPQRTWRAAMGAAEAMAAVEARGRQIVEGDDEAGGATRH